MKILIMGASCAGSTTLGTALGKQLGFPYFDTDAYFWEASEIPYTVKRSPEQRNAVLKADFKIFPRIPRRSAPDVRKHTAKLTSQNRSG